MHIHYHLKVSKIFKEMKKILNCNNISLYYFFILPTFV